MRFPWWLWLSAFSVVIGVVVVSAYLILDILDRRRRVSVDAWTQLGKHVHDWRFIASPYVRQCKDIDCGYVEYVGEIPDGLKEYVEAQTAIPGTYPANRRCELCGYRYPCAHYCKRGHRLTYIDPLEHLRCYICDPVTLTLKEEGD